MATCKLNGSLVGFGARVAKESLIRITVVTEPLGEIGLCGNKVKIGNMVHLIHLISNCFGQTLMGMSQCAGGNTRNKVEIFLSISGIEVASFSMGDGERVSTIKREEVIFRQPTNRINNEMK